MLERFQFHPPASPEVLRELQEISPRSLPSEYLALLAASDGGEGFVGDSYWILWRAQDLHELNRAYEVEKWAAGLFLIGSNGGGEALALDMRTSSCSLVQVPFVGMELGLAVRVALRIAELLAERSRSETSQSRGRPQTPATRTEDTSVLENFHIKPILLGGNPTDAANRVQLTREKHIAAVRYWNRIISGIRNPQPPTR